MKNKYICLPVLAIWLLAGSAGMAQVYVPDGNTGLFQTTSEVVTLNYRPRVPSPVIGGFFQTVALYVTSNATESDPQQSREFPVRLHVYYPRVIAGQDPSTQKLPVIVFGYGGGFLNRYSTSNDATGIERWLAARGYIVVAPEYRIGIDLYNPDLAQRAVWRAVQDMRVVNRYARQMPSQGNRFSVDHNKPLAYVGWSSGGFIGLHNLFLNNTNRPPSTRAGFASTTRSLWWRNQVNLSTYDLGALDQPTVYPQYTGDPVPDITVSIAGAIGNLNFIQTSSAAMRDKSLFLIQHRRDGVVPFGTGPAYRNFALFASPSYQYPQVSGSGAINNYFNNNPTLRPRNYAYRMMCNNSDIGVCLRGNAGGENFRLPVLGINYRTWFHDPAQNAAKNNVMNAVLKFIQEATADIEAGNAAQRVAGEASLGASPPAKPQAAISLYPNPTTGEFSLRLGSRAASLVEVRAITGKLVHRAVPGESQAIIPIDLRGYSPGLYVVHAHTKDGVVAKKVLLE